MKRETEAPKPVTNDIYAQAYEHMKAIPPSGTPWPEAPREYERVGTMRACDEAVRGWHYTVKGGDTCILCGLTLGQAPMRKPVTFVSVPAGKADTACDGLPLGYGTGIPADAVVLAPVPIGGDPQRVWIDELQAAGWVCEAHGRWRCPLGERYLGPYQAWYVMRARANGSPVCEEPWSL